MPQQRILFIPGMMCDERVWQPQLEYFSSRAHPYEAACADITRHRTMAAIGEALLREISWTSFAVAGLSMGGIVAMELLRQAPHRITRCALLDTNHRAELSDRQARRQQEIKRVQAGQLRELIVEDMKPAYLSPNRDYERDFLHLILDMAMALGAEAFINQALALRDRPDYSDTLQQTTCPLLLLCGEDDSLCPPSRHREMKELNNQADLCIIKSAGHITSLEQPAAVNRALSDWLGLSPN